MSQKECLAAAKEGFQQETVETLEASEAKFAPLAAPLAVELHLEQRGQHC